MQKGVEYFKPPLTRYCVLKGQACNSYDIQIICVFLTYFDSVPPVFYIEIARVKKKILKFEIDSFTENFEGVLEG